MGLNRLRLLKGIGVFGLLVVAIGVVADQWSKRYLKEYSERYRQEITEADHRAASYRRLVFSGRPADQNAAVWYGQAFRHVRDLPAAQIGSVVDGGFARFAETATPMVRAVCGEVR